MVEGRLRLDQWDDKQSGQKRSKLGVVGEAIQFLGGAAKQEEQPAQRATSATPTTPDNGDDVPF